MNNKKVIKNEVRKIVMSGMIAVYFFATSPFALIAEEQADKIQREEAFINAFNQSIKRDIDKKVLENQKESVNITVCEKEIPEEKVDVLITKKNGGKVILGDASIEIPAGALKEDTKISITHLKSVNSVGESLFNAIPDARGYRFLPAGTKFNKEVTVILPYNPILNTKKQALEDLYTYFYDTEKKCWIKLDRVKIDKEKCLVISKTTHFTDMINATLTLPETASPIDVNLNSIKNLEAAKPDSHLIKFNPPQANSSGDLTFSFELPLPSGRRGMQPQISVSYSSSAGNGIMGKGFDLNYGSSITIDTRFGLPKYDGSDTYMLDGVLLKKVASNEDCEYYEPLKEINFDRIIHYIKDSDNYWEVTDKAGTVRRYGEYKVAVEKNFSCVGDGNKIYTWNISETVDTRENTVTYRYFKDTSDIKDNPNSSFGAYVYIDSINYTGSKGNAGKYYVKFIYDKNEEDNQRIDVRTDGRSKRLISCKKLLTEIDTFYSGSEIPLRTYSFEYKTGAFAKESMLNKFTVSNGNNDTYSYHFDYTEPKYVNGNAEFFKAPVKWDSETSEGYPIQTGRSTNSGTSFNGSAGVGYGVSCVDVRGSYGRTGSYSEGQSYTDDTLVDINGDGRVDSVSYRNGKVVYRLNNGNGFDTQNTIDFVDLKYAFDEEKTTSSSSGWNVYGGVGILGFGITPSLGVGYSCVSQDSTSNSQCSFMDLDRDGLVDIVQAGENFYWHNESKDGNIMFNPRDITTSTADVVRVIENKSDYEEAYYIQTPFRAWKAPYDGTLVIKERLSKTDSDRFKPAENLLAKTFIGDAEEAKYQIKIDNELHSENINLTKDTKLYFITDGGKEPKNTDTIWNINLKYKNAKLFKNSLQKAKFDIPQGVSINISHNDLFEKAFNCVFKNIAIDNEFSDREQKKSFDDYCNLLLEEKETVERSLLDVIGSEDEKLLKMYEVVYKDYEDFNEVIYKYKNDWENDIKDISEIHDIYESLVESNRCYPFYFTADQFASYLNELTIKKPESDSDTREIKYYENFVHQFEYYGYLEEKGVYILREFNAEAVDEGFSNFKDFYDTYKISNKLKKEIINSYSMNEVKTSFNNKTDISYLKEEYKANNKIRSNQERGTLYKSELIYISDLINESNNGKKLYLDLSRSELIDEIGNTILSGTVECDGESKILFNHNAIDDEYTVGIKLENCETRAQTIIEKEFENIFNSQEISEADINHPYWNWEEVKEEEINEKFENLPFLSYMDSKTRAEFIVAMYKKVPKIEVEETTVIDEDTQEKKVIKTEKTLYEYYTNKETKTDEETKFAKNVLQDAKIDYLFGIDFFKFYEKDEIYGYKLRDNWIEKKQEKQFKNENIDIVEDSIKRELENYSTLQFVSLILENIVFGEENQTDEALCKNASDYDQNKIELLVEKYKTELIAALVTKKLQNVWEEYVADNNKLESMCNKNRFYKYKDISVSLIYNKEFSYPITYQEDEENSYFYITKLDSEANFLKTKINSVRLSWDSKKDFNIENHNVSPKICSYTVNIKDEDIKEFYSEASKGSEEEDSNQEAAISVGSKEYLYGGVSNWFYGIWKGVANNFNERTLEKFKNDSECSSTEDFNKKKEQQTQNANKIKSYDNENANNEKDSVFFYLPQKEINVDVTEETTDSKTIIYRNEDLTDNQNNYVDYEKILVGTVAVTSTENSIVKCCMPFISNDYIHSDRAGGAAFYKIEGLYENGETGISTKSARFPMIRRTFTTGKDTTPNVSLSVGGPSGKYSNPKNVEDKLLKSTGESASLALGYSKGKNSTDAYVKQAIQDINGDGLPDLLTVHGSGIHYSAGQLTENDGFGFDTNKPLIDSNAISANTIESTVIGGSIGCSGSVSVNAKGRSSEVRINASANPSGGSSNTDGSNSQSVGFNDFNGDGLPDYFANGKLYFNLGDTFDLFKFEGNNNNLSLSSNSSYSLNQTMSLGGGIQASSLSSGASVNCGISFGSSSSNTTSLLIDMNGDGLLDRVSMNVGENRATVQYNYGNRFGEGSYIGFDSWNEILTGYSEKFKKMEGEGYSLGSLKNLPVIGKYSKSIGEGLKSLTINTYGDKAPKLADSLEWNSSVTLGINGSLGVNVNIGIPIIILVYIGTINITGNGGAGVNFATTVNGVSVRMIDLDGDGLPDHVLRIPGYKTYWKRNISGLYGKLNRIRLPQGGLYEIEYQEMAGTTSDPHFKYVMSKVTLNDGCKKDSKINHGEHSMITCYEYEDAYYDRKTKESYGFRTVKTYTGCYDVTENSDYDGKKIQNYAYETLKKDVYNQGIYRLKNILNSSEVYTNKEKLISEKVVKYFGEDNAYKGNVALPKEESSYIYEINSPENEYLYKRIEYQYDGSWSSEPTNGDVTKLVQYYDKDGDKTIADFEYTNIGNIRSLPKSITVYDKDGQTLLRKRTGLYNQYGELTELSQYYSENESTKSTLSYDEYGNIHSVTDPNGATLTYEYDKELHQLVKKVIKGSIKSSITYESVIEYSKDGSQTKILEKDCNDNKNSYVYDSWQRLKEVWTDYDEGSLIPAVSYTYCTPDIDATEDSQKTWYAVTNNKVSFDKNSEVIQTVVQIDGLGRAVRTAKTGVKYDGISKKIGWNVTGAVIYDNKGRVIEESMTNFIQANNESEESRIDILLRTAPEMTAFKTKYLYDVLDRKVMTVLPDDSKTITSFAIKNKKHITTIEDALNNKTIQTADGRENIVSIKKTDSKNETLALTKYEYNEIGEMINASDMEGNSISINYDLLGRKIKLTSADSGTYEYRYDDCSNLIAETNSVLKEDYKEINYTYDEFNRLLRIDYPYTDSTIYEYGDGNSTKQKAVGKILKITDASGTLNYKYGSLGEVVEETRLLKKHLNEGGSVTYTMKYTSDYLGRMQDITYPDGEKVIYGYDKGGLVKEVRGETAEGNYTYVEDIGYDEYGQRIYIKYGNGVVTTYNYDKKRRWLSSINTISKSCLSLQNISYEFNPVGNISKYFNNCLDDINGDYSTDQTYTYDSLYQLTSVTGNTTNKAGDVYTAKYSQKYTFDSIGNMVSKVSSSTVAPNYKIGDDLNYKLQYTYDTENGYAHRLLSVADLSSGSTRYYQYDKNGNIIAEQDGEFDGEVSYGRSIEQISEDVQGVDYGWGIYSNEKNNTYSKNRRTYTWNEKNLLIASVDSSVTVNYMYGQDGQRTNKYTSSSETLYFNKMWTLHVDSGNYSDGGQTSKNIYLGEERIVTKLNQFNYPTYAEEYYKQYFYHSDHLKSASLITDYNGEEYQRIEYTPYGEIWVEKTNNNGTMYLPYKFTGKEMDEETGLYYYGARYLDPKYSRWLSTDPALGDYIPGAGKGNMKDSADLPGMGGIFNHINGNLYHYAGNNPIKYTDPDGNQTCPNFFSGFENPASEFWGLLSNFSSDSDKVTAKTVAALNGNETCKANLNSISPYMSEIMAKATGEVAICGMEFVSENGTMFAIAAYASGNIELGIIIDGVTAVCDVGLAVRDYKISNRTSKDKIKLSMDVATTAAAVIISAGAAKSATKNIPLGKEDLAEKLSNIMADQIGASFDTAIDSFFED